MFKTMGTIVAACCVYFIIGAAMTAGEVLGVAAAEKLVEKFEN